ncbi:TEX2 protein, partial [Acrocephalus arundinaceus]|nr:TEX2 protein [Acrocephalus arundinaceus]
QGWMKQLHVYDPELFHPSLTHSVLAALDGATLKLSYPKSNIPRRATFEEEILDAVFVSHRCYDLTDAKVFLCPPSLARKRTWNKKYPICVLLPEAAEGEGKGREEHDAEPQGDEGSRKVPVAGQDIPGDGRDRCLYLFGRTGREKEEWYQHLVQASRGTASSHGDSRAGEGQPPRPLLWARADPGTPWWAAMSVEEPKVQPGCSGSSSGGSAEDIPSSDPARDAPGSAEEIYLDYSTYMARFVPAQGAPSPEQSPSHGALGSPTPTKGLAAAVPSQLGEDTASMAWMNALVGRIFWDFLREQYWAEQVSNKIQKKLSKIKLPYFMNELTLTELDMGTSIPSVLSASNPSINERGLWVDMEVTYSGSLQMTLETKMNLSKLGKESSAEESSPAEAGREGARPRLILLADSDAESSSAGSSDEEDVTSAEPLGAPGERLPPPGTEG